MMDHWQPEIGGGPRGIFSMGRNLTRTPTSTSNQQNSMAGFMMGVYSGWNKSLQWEVMTVREWQHAFYARDRWQVNDKLTLTLGLRYEYFRWLQGKTVRWKLSTGPQLTLADR